MLQKTSEKNKNFPSFPLRARQIFIIDLPTANMGFADRRPYFKNFLVNHNFNFCK